MADEIDCSCEDILPVPTDGNLPGDVMVSILLNLPVKSLLKFKSVSKAWCWLISSSSFFKLHLHRQSLLVPNNNFLVLFDDIKNHECEFGLLIHNEDNTSDIDHFLILESLSSFTSVEEIVFFIESCNGLVFMYLRSRGFILWNPATKKYRYLKYPNDHYPYILDFNSFGLCYVEATNDFKLVGWTKRRDNPANRPPYLLVYSLSSDSWEKLDYDAKHPLVSIQRPTFISGCMNWLVRTCSCNTVCICAHVFVTLDVTDEARSCFGAPDNNRGFQSKKSMCTLVLKGYLSIVVNPMLPRMEDGFDVWVMVEYGVEESWVKRFTIHGFAQTPTPLITWNDSELVFVGWSGAVTFYDPYSKKKYCRQLKSVRFNQMLNYVESLAPVEPEEGIEAHLMNK